MRGSMRAFAIGTLLAAAFVPTRASASMSASAGPTIDQGDTCPAGSSSSGFILSQSVEYACVNREGSGSAGASSSPGALGAFAYALSYAGLNLGSEDVESFEAKASYSDNTGEFIAGPGAPGVGYVTLNYVFNAHTFQTESAVAVVLAQAYVAGQIAAECGFADGGPSCETFPVYVAFNTPLPFFMLLDLIANADANGYLTDQIASADASHTFWCRSAAVSSTFRTA